MNQNKSILGLLAVENQLISQATLDEALNILGNDCSDKSLIEYFERQQLISEANLKRLVKATKILDVRQKEFYFGSMLVNLGFINQNIVDLALKQQQDAIMNKQKPQRIGDMFVDAGFITSRQRNYVLNLQKRKRIENSQSEYGSQDEDIGLSADNKSVMSCKPIAIDELPDEFQILSKPKAIMPGLKLQVAEDGMAAYVTKGKGFDRKMQTTHLKDALKNESIIFGILSDEMLEEFIDSTTLKDKLFKVAKGVPAKDSQQVQIEYFFPANTFKPDELDEQGKINYKEREKIVQVKKGTVLAKKILSQAETSSPGFDIYGNKLIYSQADQGLFTPESGTSLSPDGLEIIAEIQGRPIKLVSGGIKVTQVYTQEDDVGYKSGHIDYDGDVQIEGIIQPDFRVSGHNITATSAQGARVIAQGDLNISDGIIDTTVYAKGNVFANFIRNAKIRCMGNVIVAGEIVDSVIICSGACSIQKGTLISSEISARKGLIAGTIGNSSTKACNIQVGKDKFIHGELESYKKQLAGIREKIDAHGEKKQTFLDQMQTLQNELTRLAHEQDTFRVELKNYENELTQLQGTGKETKIQDVEYQISRLKTNIDYTGKKLNEAFKNNEQVEDQIAKINETIKQFREELETTRNQKQQLIQWSMENSGKPIVKVFDLVHNGTKIQGTKSELFVRDETKSIIFTEVKNKSGYEIKSSPI